jgi:predicted exporter
MPTRLSPRSFEGRVLAVAWSVAAIITLCVALFQSLQMFLLAFAAVSSGTYAVLRLMSSATRDD